MSAAFHFSLSLITRRIILRTLLISLGLVVTPSRVIAQQVLSGDQENSLVGTSSSSAGDINGDGFSDVLVAGPYYSGAFKREGRVDLYLGSAQGIALTPSWTFLGGKEDAQLGASVSSAGDVNNDGFDDIIVGVPNGGQSFEGEALVFFGSGSGLARTPSWIARGASGLEHLGSSVSHAGDVNKDGFADVIVGAPGFSNGQLAEGRALVFLGSSTGLSAQPAWSHEGDLASSLTGVSVGAAGDTNGDGFHDVVVGAPQHTVLYSSEGRVSVFLGSASGLSSQAAWTLVGGQNWGQLGFSAATAGDVDRDGFDDLLVGHPGYGGIRPNAGRVLLFRGSAAGLSSIPSWTMTAGNIEAQFGTNVAGAGDINKDGFSDFVLGVRGYPVRGLRTGAAFLFLGSKAGPPTIADWSFNGFSAPGAFGASASSAGDINGDGLSDIIVGDPYAIAGGSANGAAYVFLGDRASNLAVTALSCAATSGTPPPGSGQAPGAQNPPSTSPRTPSVTPTTTPTPTPTPSPTNGGAPGADTIATPPAGLANPNGSVCAASVVGAQFSAFANARRSGCLSPATAASRRRWNFESRAGAASLSLTCDASGNSVISGLSASGTGIARGESCQGKRRFSLAATWSAGKSPAVTLRGLSATCARKLRGPFTRSLRVVTNSTSKTATLTGRVRAPLSNCSGWRAWEKFEMTVVSK